ncbi:uncharacterized protein LOC133313549 [Gastrolobium bilobum]|uniref:uncharacterized protein LOC133313549 n=1 Tax=Gastrolobium bilobum TaxID=150636 RepID=UPI002AB13436|nr:uncharacterized protein LOC133313549 [Gastrolobium bilobum]
MDSLTAWCCKLLTSPQLKAWLKQQLLIPLLEYETRLKKLEVVVQNLKKGKEVLQYKVDEEENRYGRGIPDEVKKWIDVVDKIISEYDHFLGEEEHHKLAVFDLLASGGYLPHPGIRYRRSRTAYNITKKVNALQQTAKEDTLSYWLRPPSLAAFFSNVGYESFQSRDETVKKIKAALEDSNVKMIGLHGFSGVGKTTLVKEVAKGALDEKKFNVVTMANVTRNPDIRKIQGQIADMLGITLDEESDIARATRIQMRLKDEKDSVLIILDDLWAKLDFNMLGIPSGDDDVQTDVEEKKSPEEKKTEDASRKKETEDALSMIETKETTGAHNGTEAKETLSHYKGCKVLLISETKQVLLSHMEGKEDFIFSLEVLKDKEAEMLFKNKSGVGDTQSEFEKLAAQIAKKCDGLPMHIVTTARALKNQSRSAWEDANRKLECQKLTGVPEFATKLSYTLLENEELKYTFLLCAHMGHDALVMDLVKYCIGLGFLQGISKVKEAKDRVYAMVEKLKEAGLLSNGYSNDHFTMQAIVRSAALSIASNENKHVFKMTNGEVDEWPDEDKLKRYNVISLQHCHIIEGFPLLIKCPRLRVFHVNNNDPSLKISDNFFKGMKELKVLILTGFNLSPFPSSIKCLTKLRMLCLEHCVLREGLSIIGQLKKLRILSLSGSDIEKLPPHLNELTKLQIFDISDCLKLQEIPSNVISSFISLEELYMRNTLVQWNMEGGSDQSKKASLSELSHLNQLTTLDIQIPNIDHLPNNLFFDKLYSYKIVIGDLKAYLETDFKMPEKYEISRFLAVQLKNCLDIHSQMGIKMLFKRVEILLLEDLKGVEDIFYRLNLKGFPYLKHLSIVRNSEIQSLINPKDSQHPVKAFPKLESLYLYNLDKMGELCSCNLSAPSFGKLKVMKINMCDKLENVFLLSVVKLLTLLETIEVSECKSLKEIVQAETPSNPNEVEYPKFPELRSLTLQSLSKFIGFYTTSSTGGDTKKILLHEKVEVFKLERMELSSIQIDLIWSVQPPLSSNFQNLIHLDVNDCSNLECLLSLSMAKNLGNLQSLFISECEKMEHIFLEEQDSDDKMEGNIFPNLKNIKLSSMKSLRKIWAKLPLYSFGKLDTLIIEECDKLDKVFPCYMEGVFRSLCNLRITNCKSMEAIFDLDNGKQDAGDITNLQDIHLEALPKLKHVWKWSNGQKGLLKLNNLRNIWVQDCVSLENIFPISIANCLYNLEYLLVWDCSQLREMVAQGEVTNNNTSNPNPSFEFLKLTTIKFLNLPKLKSFYPGNCELRFPVLNDLSIEHCDKLEPFPKKTADAQSKSILFPEEVINKLKFMRIELWHANSSSSYMGEENYRRDNLEELHLSRLWNTKILYFFLHRNPNLESLTLSDSSFKEVVPHVNPPEIKNLGVVPELKSLKLIDLPELENIGFERHIVLQRIEFLSLNKCPRLATIVPPSVSLTHLTSLEVVNCKLLKYLMPSTTAKSLGQLKTLKVVKCESLKEVVGNETENADKVVIVFRQLKALELISLGSFESFCNSKSYIFEFPAMEKLVVSACPKMEKFSQEVKDPPILRKVYVVHEGEKKRSYWRGNLNATIQKIFKEKSFFEGMGEISLSEHPDLQEAWGDKNALQNSWFYSLKTLKLFKCKIQPCAIPSHVLPYLNNLQELEVSECSWVNVIFHMNSTEVMGKLKKLSLQNLRGLTHVWENYHEGMFSFQNLQEVFVNSCHNLKTLFPEALAENLKKLEKLEIKSCYNLQEIVEKEEDATAAQVTKEFVFPRLTSLVLYDLSKLTNFYPKAFTLECPELNSFIVYYCNNLEVFHSGKEAHPNNEVSSTSSIKRHSLFSDPKVIPNLEELRLEGKQISMLRLNLEQSKKELKRLKQLFLLSSYYGDRVPFEILEMTPNLETMFIATCCVSEIGQHKMPEHLKTLFLHGVWGLMSIGSEDLPWLNTLCEKLHKLCLYRCRGLTTLLRSVRSSTVSFSDLKELIVEECDGLKYLLTSSAAKKLRHLEEIRVSRCKWIKEIVAKEEDEITSEDIKFEQLDKIVLKDLSRLECFYSGNVTLQLPSLIQVDIKDCPKMEKFSQGLIHAKSFRGILFSSHSNSDLVFQDDLNTSINQYTQLVLRPEKYPTLEKVWLQRETATKLAILKYMSESTTAKILPNLKRMEVGDCNSMKEIVAKEGDEIIFKKLEILIFESLPRIGSFELGRCTLNFPCLEEVSFINCHGMKYLFTSSTAKTIKRFPNLKEIRVFDCESLEEIVAKEGDESDEYEIIFEKLENLTLESLPKLRSFDLERSTLNFPCLKKVSFIDCHGMKHLFTSSATKSIKRFPNLEEISVRSCESLEEIVAKVGDKADEYEIIFEKLEIFTLVSLPRLGSLDTGSSTLNFPCLKEMKFSRCHSMKYLFTYSTAKRLPNLKEICVSECESIKEIVAKEGDESEEDQTILQWLEILRLSWLWKLESFYSGSSTLNFPCLKKLVFFNCHNLKIFRYADIVPKELEVIRDYVRWEGDINDVIKQQLRKEVA